MNETIPMPVAGQWRHSFEEDAAGVRVYRRAEFPFPRARGRAGMDLLSGGELVNRPIGPVDAPLEQHGRWRLEGSAQLVLEIPGKPLRIVDIVACTPDRLTVRDHTR